MGHSHSQVSGLSLWGALQLIPGQHSGGSQLLHGGAGVCPPENGEKRRLACLLHPPTV